MQTNIGKIKHKHRLLMKVLNNFKDLNHCISRTEETAHKTTRWCVPLLKIIMPWMTETTNKKDNAKLQTLNAGTILGLVIKKAE